MKDFAYQHIDNGGITFDIKQDAEYVTTLEFKTQYFGYPAIKTELSGLIDPDFLRSIASLCNVYADRMTFKNKEE